MIHRDIKLENILIQKDSNGNIAIKVADFGIATKMNSSLLNKEKNQLGSLHYIAPEIVNYQPATPKSDVWSACVVIYSLF